MFINRDMVGIAHGEESIDRAVLVAAYRVNNGMPIEKKKTEKRVSRQHYDIRMGGSGRSCSIVLIKAHRMAAS